MSISYWMHRQTSNKRGTKPQKLNVLSRLAVVVAKSNQVLNREWRCSWSSADRRCSNYIWVISNCIAYLGVAYIRGLMALYLVSASVMLCTVRCVITDLITISGNIRCLYRIIKSKASVRNWSTSTDDNEDDDGGGDDDDDDDDDVYDDD